MDNVIKVLDAENLKLRALIQQYYPQNTFSMSTHALPPPTEQFYIGHRNIPGKSTSSSTPTSGVKTKGYECGKETALPNSALKQPRPTHSKQTRRNTPIPDAEGGAAASLKSAEHSPSTPSFTTSSSNDSNRKNPVKRQKLNDLDSNSNSDSDTMFNGSGEGSDCGSANGSANVVSDQPDSSVTQSSKGGSTKGSSNSSSSSSSSVASGDEDN
jgi:hypothetical protein